MMMKIIKVGETYKSKSFGDFVIIENNGWDNVVVEFVATGYRALTRRDKVKEGAVKDKLMPLVYGVGFIGDGEYGSRGADEKAHKTWVGMLERCYCDKYQSRQPTYKGCSVCCEWHNFQNFAEWFYNNYVDGFQLDKDIKEKGNKIYCADACLFVSARDNSVDASEKRYIFTSPSGAKVELKGLASFCRENSLDRNGMMRVNNGKQQSHQGWTAS